MAKRKPASVQRQRETANERFKRTFGDRLWGSLITATVLHFLLFALWPQMSAADVRSAADPPLVLDYLLPPLPPPPEDIVRPATPVVSMELLDADVTIPPTSIDRYSPEILHPPARAGSDLAAGPVFTPRTVEPTLRNRAAVERALERSYPRTLRDAGIGGSPTIWLLVDEDGRVVQARVNESSLNEQLDRAALDVARMMEFSPAYNHDRRVPVWVSIPIVFQSR